jgi:hypothetical protein
MKNKSKYAVTSSLDKTFGGTVSDPKVRKELLEMFYNTLTSNVAKVSSHEFLAKVDLCGNFLHDIEGFANSLSGAVEAILSNHPNDGENSCDSELQTIMDLCTALNNGVEITNQYIESMKAFGNDLDTIKSELNNSLVGIHGEIA